MTDPIERREFQPEFREVTDNPDQVAELHGRAVPYGVDTDLGGIREQFAADAFEADKVIGTPLAYRHDDAIGHITAAENREDGLYVTATIANTTQGRDVAALLRAGSIKGLSVGFLPLQSRWNEARDAVTRIQAGLRELSVTPWPAYATAGVSTIREESPVDNEVTPEESTPAAPQMENLATREELREVRDEIAALTITERQAAPVSNEVVAEAFHAFYNDRERYDVEYREVLNRAWASTILTGTASDNAPFPSSVSAEIDRKRPTFTAIGADPLGATGMKSYWMTPGVLPVVGVQATEKTEVASVAASGALVEASVITLAGGADLSMQFVQRADGWTYSDWLRELGIQYAQLTNEKVLETLATTTADAVTLADASSASVGAMLGAAASSMVKGTADTPDVMVLGPDTYFQVVAAAGNGFPHAGGIVGNGNVVSTTMTQFGLQVVCDSLIDESAGTLGYVINRRMVGLREAGTFRMSNDVASKVGRDESIYGYMASALLNDAGVVPISAAAAQRKAS
jgi:HK97 family phage prohead protease